MCSIYQNFLPSLQAAGKETRRRKKRNHARDPNANKLPDTRNFSLVPTFSHQENSQATLPTFIINPGPCTHTSTRKHEERKVPRIHKHVKDPMPG